MFVDAWDITFRYSDFGMELDWILVMVWDVPAILSVLVLNKNIMNERSKLDGVDSELDQTMITTQKSDMVGESVSENTC